ncbi:MAG TPA: LysR family transcriptional regulator [Pseudonocardiaceae bacterium]|nr:LysR family transcriptional regulator [Pseudonocardiaceae bacterium]
MTLTQLSAFVLVARLGTVKAAASALNVSEPAVSQAIAALRQHLHDRLLVRGPGGMTLTPGGSRLLTVAAQMVALGAEAEAAVRAGRGAPEQLRLLCTSTIAEFVGTPLADAFTRRAGGSVEVSAGVATVQEMPVLLANRLADAAIGPAIGKHATDLPLDSEPIFRGQLVVVGAGRSGPAAGPLPWLVDPTGTDPGSDTGRLLRLLRITDSRVRVFPNQTAAWAAAADGGGVAPGYLHLLSHQIQRGELAVVESPATPMDVCWHLSTPPGERRSAAANSLRHFLRTPDAMQLMRFPGVGVPPSRFRPPVYVTIWS